MKGRERLQNYKKLSASVCSGMPLSQRSMGITYKASVVY